MMAKLLGLLLRVGTLQALTLRGPPTLRGGPSFATSAASRSRLSPAQAVAESSVVVELEARLNRRLTASEIIFAHETVSVVRDLELRLRQQDTLVVSDTGTVGVEEAGGAAVASGGGAAVAAASWGSWRIRAPTDARARAHHILVESEAKALELMKELIFGADIGELARLHSLCPSRDQGGDLGSFVPAEMAHEFSAFIFDERTPTNAPVGPIKTPFGYHVIVIDERTL
jgi:peptidyl-prolyl cis-trans isomerase C